MKTLRKFGINGPKEGIFIVHFSSKWCKSCKSVFSILEKFRDNSLIELQQINVDENSKLARELDIHAVPALLFFKDGKLLEKSIEFNGETFVNKGIMIGAINEMILKEIIQQM